MLLMVESKTFNIISIFCVIFILFSSLARFYYFFVWLEIFVWMLGIAVLPIGS